MSQVIDLTCPKCGAPLEIHKELSELSCPYCGYKKALMESDAVKIERLRTEAYKEVALQKERLSQKSQKTDAASKKKKLRWKIGLILAAIFAVILLPSFPSSLIPSATPIITGNGLRKHMHGRKADFPR